MGADFCRSWYSHKLIDAAAAEQMCGKGVEELGTSAFKIGRSHVHR